MNILAKASFVFYVVHSVDAELEYVDQSGATVGETFTIFFRYKPGKNPNARSFEAKFYQTAAARLGDWTRDAGVGLADIQPPLYYFVPDIPSQNPDDANEWLDAKLVVRANPTKDFESTAEEHTYFLKITMIRGEDDDSPGPGIVTTSDDTSDELPEVSTSSTNNADGTITVTATKPSQETIDEALTETESATATGWVIRSRAQGRYWGQWIKAYERIDDHLSSVIDDDFISTLIQEDLPETDVSGIRRGVNAVLDIINYVIEYTMEPNVEVEVRPTYQLLNTLHGHTVEFIDDATGRVAGHYVIKDNTGTVVEILPEGTVVENRKGESIRVGGRRISFLTTSRGEWTIIRPGGHKTIVPHPLSDQQREIVGSASRVTFSYPAYTIIPTQPISLRLIPILGPLGAWLNSAVIRWDEPLSIASGTATGQGQAVYRYKFDRTEHLNPRFDGTWQSVTAGDKHVTLNNVLQGVNYRIQVQAGTYYRFNNVPDINGNLINVDKYVWGDISTTYYPNFT